VAVVFLAKRRGAQGAEQPTQRGQVGQTKGITEFG